MKWQFDSYGDETSFVEVVESNRGLVLNVVIDEKTNLSFNADRDQWGTWIGISGSGCVAQEDCTRSFVDAMIAALQEFRSITDIQTKPPTLCQQEKTDA